MTVKKSVTVLKTASPSVGTPTASLIGKRDKINGVHVWLKGESPSYNGSNRSPYNERAAYIISEVLNLKLVPQTVLYIREGELVSAMKWVHGNSPAFVNKKPPLLKMFDYIIRNSDRHSGNWLIKPSGDVWAIDNALSFHPWVEAFDIDEELPDKVKVRINEVLKDTRNLRRRLKPLLDEEQICAVIKRLRIVLKMGNWKKQSK